MKLDLKLFVKDNVLSYIICNEEVYTVAEIISNKEINYDLAERPITNIITPDITRANSIDELLAFLKSVLLGLNAEIFSSGRDLYMLVYSNIIPYEKWPLSVKDKFNLHFMSDTKNIRGVNEMGFHGKQGLEKYVWCNYGVFDIIPDLDKNDAPVSDKFERRTDCVGCKYRGIVCKGVSKRLRDNKKLFGTKSFV